MRRLRRSIVGQLAAALMILSTTAVSAAAPAQGRNPHAGDVCIPGPTGTQTYFSRDGFSKFNLRACLDKSVPSQIAIRLFVNTYYKWGAQWLGDDYGKEVDLYVGVYYLDAHCLDASVTTRPNFISGYAGLSYSFPDKGHGTYRVEWTVLKQGGYWVKSGPDSANVDTGIQTLTTMY